MKLDKNKEHDEQCDINIISLLGYLPLVPKSVYQSLLQTLPPQFLLGFYETSQIWSLECDKKGILLKGYLPFALKICCIRNLK